MVSNGALRDIRDQRTGGDDFLILCIAGGLWSIRGYPLAIVVRDKHLRGESGDRGRANRVAGAGGCAGRAPLRQRIDTFNIRAANRACYCVTGDSCAEIAGGGGKGQSVAGEYTAVEQRADSGG